MTFHLIRSEQIAPSRAFAGRSSGFTRASIVGPAAGSIHIGLALCALEGHVETHLHSYEESFYVLKGEPVVHIGDDAVRLRPGACGVIPVGMTHAWQADASASWIEMCSPPPRGPARPPDTFFTGGVPDGQATTLDARDGLNRHLFLLSDADMDISVLQQGASVSAPTVSASMATAALAYSGITVKMLVDQRLDAALHTMFMVDYQPGAVAHPHDHPFEEAYYMLAGEVDVVADGERFTLYPGDGFWTSAGCVHAFYEVKGGRVRWLETSAPQPPGRHSYRFERDWEYVVEKHGASPWTPEEDA